MAMAIDLMAVPLAPRLLDVDTKAIPPKSLPGQWFFKIRRPFAKVSDKIHSSIIAAFASRQQQDKQITGRCKLWPPVVIDPRRTTAEPLSRLLRQITSQALVGLSAEGFSLSTGW